MSGPSLQLNITAPGQQKVEQTVSAVERLAAALRDLPKASAELAKLQKALSGVQPPSGLKGGAGDLKELVGEIKNLGAQLNTSFGSLEETIKKGWGKAAAAQVAGQSSLKSATGATRGLTFPSVGSAGQPVEVPAAWFAKMQTGALKIKEASLKAAETEARAIEAAAARVEAATQAADAKLQARFARRYAREEQERIRLQVNSSKMAEAARLAAEKEAASLEAAAAKLEAATQKADARLQERFNRRYAREEQDRIRLQVNSSKMAEAARLAAEKEAASLEAAAVKLEAAAQKADARLAARFERKYAREEQERIRLQVNSSKMAEAARLAAEKEAASLEAAAAKLEAATQKADARLAARFARKYAREEQERIRLQVNSAKMAEAARMAAEKEAVSILASAEKVLAAQRTADAKYAAMSQRGQARVTLQARSRLDQGIAPEAVAGSFGGAALQSAQQTTLANAMAKVHGEVDRGAPKFKTLGVAMGDAHSAARGLASGFGAMYLTWGNLGPLLAGAAISQSFVSSIKLGVEARQSLETLKVLSQETEESVAKLEAQMGLLARTGPFGPTQVAEAMKTLSLAGLNAAEVSATIKPALDFAVAGGVTIEKSAETLAAVGTAYGYAANQYSLVSDAITKAAAISMSSVDSMAESFRASTMIAQAYGVSLKDAATGLALLANVGIRGSSAGVALRQMYSELSGASRVTREGMKKLGVDVLDTEGKMRDLLSIAEDLSRGLEKFSGKARVRAIQDISNERGGKGLVAVVSAVESKVLQDMEAEGAKSGEAYGVGFNKRVTDKFRLIRDQMDEMEGFAATAAARLSSTPQAMLKGVAASFQQTLVDAFKAVEPTLLVLSAQLRGVLNSPEFISGVTSLVKSVASFTSVVFESAEALKALGVGFLVYKGAQAALLTMELLSAAMATSAVRTGLAAVGFTSMGAAAAAAVPAVGGLAAATGVLSATLRLAGPLAVAITLAAVAWQTYAKHSEDARKVSAEADRQRTTTTLEALRAEADRLHDVNQQVLKGADAHYAEAKAKEESARQSRRLAFDEGRTALVEEVEAARKRALIQGFDGKPLKENQAGVTEAVTRLRTFEDGYSRDEAAMRFQAARVRGEALLSEALRKKAQDEAPKRPAGVAWDGTDPRAAAAMEAAAAKETRSLKQQFDAQDRLAQTAFDREMALLNMKQKAKALSEETYEKYAEDASRRLFESEIKNLQGFVSAAETEMQRLRGTKGGDALAAAIQVDYEEAVSKLAFNLQKVKLAAELKLREPIKPDKDTLRFAKELQDLMIDLQRPLPRITDNRPKWEQELEGWAKAQKVLEDARDDFMNGWIQSGRTMWGEFLKTGKLNLKSLGDQVMETIADITYKQFIAKPLSTLGESIFDGGIKMTAGAQGGGSATGDLDTTLENLRIAAGDLGVSFQNLGSNAWKMLMDFGRGLAATLSGSGGGGGWVSTLTNLFTQRGGGGGGGVEAAPVDAPFFSAKGNAFHHGALAFASGGVVDRPQYFKFGKGGSNLGLMGEAGPEAILPLARGADGNLGVRAQGAAGGATNVTVASKTTVVIENHGGGPEPEVQTNTQPNGDEMIRVVIKAAAKDMTTGGPLRKAARSSNNLPRY